MPFRGEDVIIVKIIYIFVMGSKNERLFILPFKSIETGIPVLYVSKFKPTSRAFLVSSKKTKVYRCYRSSNDPTPQN